MKLNLEVDVVPIMFSGYVNVKLGDETKSIHVSVLSREQLTLLCNDAQKRLFEEAGHPVECIRPTESAVPEPEDYSKLPPMSDYTFATTLSAWFEGLELYAGLDFTELNSKTIRYFYVSEPTALAFWNFFNAVNSVLEVTGMSRAEFEDKLHEGFTPSDE